MINFHGSSENDAFDVAFENMKVFQNDTGISSGNSLKKAVNRMAIQGVELPHWKLHFDGMIKQGKEVLKLTLQEDFQIMVARTNGPRSVERLIRKRHNG